jgi:hypothetical protein
MWSVLLSSAGYTTSIDVAFGLGSDIPISR